MIHDDIGKEVVVKPILSWLRRHPKVKSVVFVLFILSIVAIPAIKLIMSGWKPRVVMEKNQYGLLITKHTLGTNTESQNIADALAPNKKPEPQFNSDCQTGWVCSNFDNIDFSGWNEYSINQLNTRSIQVSVDSVYDNPPLFFRSSETKIDFTVILKAIPRSPDKGNIVISWNDSWRCIIAESSYNKVTCEGNYQDTKKIDRVQKFLSTLNKKPISPNNELLIEIKSSLITPSNKNKIQMNINYIDILGNKESADFEWLFGLKTVDTENFKQLLGVGIIDPNNDKTEVEFKRLELLPTK